MCGICGYAGWPAPAEGAETLLGTMTDALRHRGPDSAGHLVDADVALGMRRLRVIDLETGDQPLFNEDRSVATVFNGEIYNYRELRRELEGKGHRFRTRSDTEVIVHLYEELGDAFASRLSGMFAIALWDTRRRRLLLIRDPVGIKPLLYWQRDGLLLFGSEAKALFQHPACDPALDRQGLHYLLNLRYVPGQTTLFRGVRKLPPGSCLTWSEGATRLSRYHRFEFDIERGRSRQQWLQDVDQAMDTATKRHLISDVPLGVYLSGGIDSSALVAYACARRDAPLETFALGFREGTDENADARFVADHFGTHHRDEYVSLTPLESLPAVIGAMEEPKINQLQGYLLSGFARRYVTVILSGLGGDELFGGYVTNRFLEVGGLLHRFAHAPLGSLGRGAARGLFRLGNAVGALSLDEYRRGAQMLLSAGDPEDFYLILRNAWDLDAGAFRNIYAPGVDVGGLCCTKEYFRGQFRNRDLTFLEACLAAEFRTKLVDDFLLNEDRTSMAHSLESRVPLLDHELVQLCLRMPGELKVHRGRLKVLMKEALQHRLPRQTLQKKKWGFAFNPYEQYRKDLKGVAQRVLTERRVREQGLFNYSYIQRILAAPSSPRLRWHYAYLWLLVGFDVWQRIFIDGTHSAGDPLEAFYA